MTQSVNVSDPVVGVVDKNRSLCDVADIGPIQTLFPCFQKIFNVGDIKFIFVPNSMKIFCYGTNIGHQHHKRSECDIDDWILMLVT